MNFVEFLITTTGTQDPVVFTDLGERSFSHPTTDFDLASNFTLDEIRSSSSVFDAITAGYITATFNGDDVTLATDLDEVRFNGSNNLLIESSTMGVVEGGELTVAGSPAFLINVADGFGFLEVEPEIIKSIVWGNTSISIPPSSTQYIYFNNAGTLSLSPSLPNSFYNIIMGRAVASSTGIEILDISPLNSEHTSNNFDKMFRAAIGPVFASGSIVTVNGFSPPQPRHLDVGSGHFFFTENEFFPTGGNDITFTSYYRDGLLGWVRTSTNEVDNGFYDDGSGTLQALTAGYYAKHSFFIVGQGAQEQYFLVYAQTQWPTLLQAQQALSPLPPGYFTDGVAQIAGIIIQEGNTDIVQIRDQRPTVAFRSEGVNAASRHGDLLGLLNDDHPQYLLINGTRDMSGDLNLGNNQIVNTSNIVVGATTPIASSAIDINSTTGALVVSRMTMGERDALSASNGMIIFDTTSSQFEVYQNGWIGLSGFTGVSGVSGFTGVSGFSGVSGKSGFSGFSGFSGVSNNGAFSQSTPGDPATTTSTTGVMMGLAGSFTPTGSGIVQIIISGDIDNTTVLDGAQVQIRYGTGTAPTNGAALTGTTAGALSKMTNPSTVITPSRTQFSVNAIVSGLTLNTAYWIDLSLASVTGGTARIRDISISALEIGVGASGVSGYSGYSGTSGTSGYSGTSGTTGGGAVSAILSFGSTNGPAAGNFLRAWQASTADNTENAEKKIVIPGPDSQTRTLKNARAIVQQAPGGTDSDTFTIRKNGINTSLVVTITGASTSGSDTTNTVSVTSGDIINVQFGKVGSPASSTQTAISIELV